MFFLALGLLAVVTGGHDLLLSAQLTYRIVGASVVLVGIVLVASAVGFARRRAWAYSYSVGGGIAAGVFAAILFVAQWVSVAHGFRLLLWAMLAVVCVAAALAVGREGRVSLGRLARRRVQVASSVLSIGALLSIAQFWNAAVRVPPTSAPSLSITTDLEQLPSKACETPVAATVQIRKSPTKQLPPKPCLTPVAATVKIRNTASSKVWVLGSLYEVWGNSAKARTKLPLTLIQGDDRAVRREYVAANKEYEAALKSEDKKRIERAEARRAIADKNEDDRAVRIEYVDANEELMAARRLEDRKRIERAEERWKNAKQSLAFLRESLEEDEFTSLITDRGMNNQLGFGASRHVVEGFDRLVETGKLLGENTYLVPGEEYTFDLLAYVPPKRYDLLRFEVVVCVAKDTLVLDETQSDPPRVTEDPPGSRLTIERDIRETSWLARLLHGRRYARIEVVLDRSSGIMDPYLTVSVDRRGRKATGADDPETLRMARLYGVAYSDSWFELALK